MSYIGFMENTVKHIEILFQYYFKNKKKYPSATEKRITKTLSFRWSVYTDMEKWKMSKSTKN